MVSNVSSSIVSAEWLLAQGADEGIRLLDASWHIPSSGRNAKAEFTARALPNAVFFDIDLIADPLSPLPHTLPTAQDFASAVAGLGINAGDHIVVYDSVGIMSAPRAWWMFRAFGYNRVSVLNGGLPAWTDAGGDLGSGSDHPLPRGDFSVEALNLSVLPQYYIALDELKDALASELVTVIDARPEGRFLGLDPEPRPQLSSGHMPGAINIPFVQCVNSAGARLRSAEDLETIFQGVPPNKPIVTSCGSGVTACVLALALDHIGRSCRVFDGSWTEWASGNNPICRKAE